MLRDVIFYRTCSLKFLSEGFSFVFVIVMYCLVGEEILEKEEKIKF